MKTITIQPAQQPDGRLPFPYFVTEGGAVGRQDYWKGDPLNVIGFQNRFDVQQVDVLFEEFWADPDLAIGKYVVLEDAQGTFSTWLTAIETVRVKDDEQASA